MILNLSVWALQCVGARARAHACLPTCVRVYMYIHTFMRAFYVTRTDDFSDSGQPQLNETNDICFAVKLRSLW